MPKLSATAATAAAVLAAAISSGLTYSLNVPLTPLKPIALTAAVVHFSPHGGCTDALVDQIDQATQSIYVQSYSFTSKPILAALAHAKQRGVAVAVLMDKSVPGSAPQTLQFLHDAGITYLVDTKHAIAHNKIMIVDERYVATGSFNFTEAAESHNAENSIIIDSPALAKVYLANWHAHQQHCVRP